MIVTKKQKRVINLALIIALISVIVLAMGLGIYFIIKFGVNNDLSKEQIEFGKLINLSYKKPASEDVDISLIQDETGISEVIYVDDSYIVYKADGGLEDI